MLNNVFSQQKLLENLDFIVERCTVLVNRIKEESNKNRCIGSASADIYEFLGLFSVEVICQFTFGLQFHNDESREDRAFLRGMDNSAARLPVNMIFPWLYSTGIGNRLPGSVGAAYRGFAAWELINRHLLERYLALRDQGTNKTDSRLFVAPLIDAVDGYLGRKLVQPEIEEEIMGITFAGSGTTSNTLAFLIYALAKPDGQIYQEQLRKELLQHPDGYHAIKDLPYLNAIIKETLRLYPTIPSTLPRVLDSDQTISGMILPKGTVVGMQNFVHHRDPAVFPSPDQFLPQRWLTESSKTSEASLTPFSLGEHNCIGQNLAKVELCLAVSHIFRATRLTLADSMTKDDMEMEDRFSAAPRGRKLVVDVEIL
jgi:cytochrome P450